MGCCFCNNFGCFDLMLRKALRSVFFLNILVCNTRIYNLISVPKITRLLLGDAIILSKTVLHNGSKIEKRKYGKIENNKIILKILSFIRIHCLKQQSCNLR